MAAGARRITARYLPTAKNGMVRDLFDGLGFERVAEDTDGARTYRLALSASEPVALPLQIVRPPEWVDQTAEA